jgi:hypothetical protein
MKSATPTCKAKAPPTVRQLMALRFELKAKAKPSRRNIPMIPVIRDAFFILI